MEVRKVGRVVAVDEIALQTVDILILRKKENKIENGKEKMDSKSYKASWKFY